MNTDDSATATSCSEISSSDARQDPVVELQQLTTGHGTQIVSSDISHSFAPGECCLLCGPNGAGKSTFLDTVLGIIPPLSGRVIWRNADYRRRVGYVPQAQSINPLLPATVIELVELGLVNSAVPVSQRRAVVAEALRAAALLDLGLCDFQTLSGGQKQRVLLARALVRDPLLLALDEPLRGLDGESAAMLLQALVRYLDRGDTTLVVATHFPHRFARIATHQIDFDLDRVTLNSLSGDRLTGQLESQSVSQ